MQRRLNGLGFDTKVTGKFDDETRAVITRWQAARGYPNIRLPQQAAAQGAADRNRREHANEFRRHPTITRLAGSAKAAAAVAGVVAAADPGAAFVGGVVGGMMGGLFRH